MRLPGCHRGERGVAIILTVGVLAVFLLAFLVLAVDFAYIYVARGELQNEADAAALAGASMLPDLTAATDEATRVAAENPVAGGLAALEDADMTAGYWNGTGFEPGQTPFNAFKVVARRMGDNAVPLFFGGIINRPAMDISRVAIAMKSTKGVAPIAVNEYWEGDSGPGLPESRFYPNSFFRVVNINGSDSTNWVQATDPPDAYGTNHGKPLALAGGNAIPNTQPMDKGGYVVLDFRTDCYSYGVAENWYELPGYTPPSSGVNLEKDMWAGYLDFYPHSPPLTIGEAYLPNYHEGSGTDIISRISDEYGNLIYGNPTSPLSYATVAYFSGTGVGLFIDEMIDDGNYRGGRFAPGRDIVVLVYDGLISTGSGSLSKRVTVVGYAKVRIIGYGNNLQDAMDDPYDENATTAYGYAVEPLRECTTISECEEVIRELSGDEAAVLVK